MPLSVVESNVRSRTGSPDDSADLLVNLPHLVAVISGVSLTLEKPTGLPRGLTPARFAATVGMAGLRTLNPRATLQEAVETLTAGLEEALRHVKPGGQTLHVGYSFSAVSHARREVWQVGHAYALWEDFSGLNLPGNVINLPPSLAAVAKARALILHAMLAKGGPDLTAEKLRVNDPTQALIAPFLTAHAALANATSPMGYGLITGQNVPAQHLHVQAIPPGPYEISLASGGYPTLKGTLAATERFLKELLADDPLLITRFPYIRPVRPDHESYADRAYARVRVW